MEKFFLVISGSGLDRKIDFSDRNIMLPAGYFLGKKGLTRNPYIPESNSWFLDSGGFSLLTKWHSYPFLVEEYAMLIKKKKPHYAAIMDFPCEPELLITLSALDHSKKNELSTEERIEKTVGNAEQLIYNYDFNTTIIPVIQGWELDDYRHCIDLYRKKDLLTDYVAFGSMCRRTSVKEMRKMVVKLTDYLCQYIDAKTHFFGFKISFLRDYTIQERVYSADTAAWTHNQTSGRKRMYATTQKELERNYYTYLKKLDFVLNMFIGQQKLNTTSEAEK